jgi:hypothetical protein
MTAISMRFAPALRALKGAKFFLQLLNPKGRVREPGTSELSDHLLRDIGLNQGEAAGESRRRELSSGWRRQPRGMMCRITGDR